MIIALLTTILLVGCGQQEAPTTELSPINTIEVEMIEVETIEIEDNITYWEDVETKNAKDLRHNLAEQKLYFDTVDGVILIYGTDYCYEDNKLMAKVEFDESTNEIKKVTINCMVITTDVYSLLCDYTDTFKSDPIL